jgi:sigma-B regulation protein RsbU (phosphoserine phosphatase)
MEQVRAQGLSRVKVDLQAMGNTREMQELGSIFNDMQDAVYKAVEDLRETTAAKERIESELSIARQIQTSLLQTIFPPLPARPEFELYAAMDPAKEVGGDFYDFFTADNGDFVFAVGDVSSKGVPASLFMAINMALLKVLVKQVGSAPAEVMNRLNDELASNNETCMFVTLFLGVVNPKTGEVRYASAGHNPPLFIHGNGDITYLEGSGDMVAGAMEGCTYREDRLTMRPGDVLLLYTDGVTEAMNAEQALYSPERLRSSVNRHCGKDPAEMIRDIRRDVDAFVGNAPQADDLTMMALRFRGNTT